MTAAAFLAVGITACAGDTHEPLSPPGIPAFDFVNGPNALPYVMRFEAQVIFGFRALEDNLAVIVGAPDDPTEHRLCGGTNRGQSVSNQFVAVRASGELAEIIKEVSFNRAANVRVYDDLTLSLADALCSGQPIAMGVGFFLRTDNDFLGGFGRGNAFSEHSHGVVESAAGGTALLERGCGESASRMARCSSLTRASACIRTATRALSEA
jgi:hypothetical protein